MEFPEGRGGGGSILGADFGKSRGGRGHTKKSLPWGVWIFSGTTQYNFMCVTSASSKALFKILNP